MVLLYIFLLVLFYYCLQRSWSFLRVLIMAEKFEGPKYSSFILGHWKFIRQSPDVIYRNLKQLSQQYYPHFCIRIFNVSAILILSPEDCEIFLATRKHARKSIIYDMFKPWLRDGLLISSGDKWLKRRKILTPAFHFNILKDYIKVFNEKTDYILETFHSKKSEAVNVVPILQKFSLSAINETAIGHKTGKDDENHKEYREAIEGMEEVFNYCLTRPWLAYKLLALFSSFIRKQLKYVDILHRYTGSIIKHKMENIDDTITETITSEDDDTYFTSKKKQMAMLDIMIHAYRDGKQIDYDGICEEVDTFTFEGHDTVSSAMSFCLMNIASHPKIQNEVLEEIKSVLGDGNQNPTYDDLNRLELLERCIKETLRLYPSVHLISRIVDEDTVLNSGMVVPKDGVVHIPIAFVHRNPNIYPDPEVFDPDRFLPENCQHRHPFAYIPFSAGPRNCIGQRFAMLEMKVLISAVIRNFELIPMDTPESIELRSDAILRAQNGIRVRFRPRI